MDVLVNEQSLIDIAGAIRDKNNTENTYTPGEMAAAIGELKTEFVTEPLEVTKNGVYTLPEGVDGFDSVKVETNGVEMPEEAFVITGDCQHRFSYGGWDWYVEEFGDKITTKDIKPKYMFYYSKLKEVPFELNLAADSAGLERMFSSSNLETCPIVKGTLKTPTGNYSYNPSLEYLFYDCKYLREIPYDFFNNFGGDEFWAAAKQYSANRANIFQDCQSLRRLPDISKLINKQTSFYSSTFKNCYALDEITNVPVNNLIDITSNFFSSTFNNCQRIKKLTFATDNGAPYVANWKGQTIDLSDSIGYDKSATLTYTKYNSGITVDKRVENIEKYQELKNNPDWFTSNPNYSRYNHDSAVETINSLPDTSAYLATAGGTNTIKFRGDAGRSTDGGAINTLTEAEIAVATAKGWTVTLA